MDAKKILCLVILLLCAFNSYATDRIFTDASVSNSLWNNVNNWNTTAPGSSDNALIGVSGYADDTNVPLIDSTHTGGSKAQANHVLLGYSQSGDFQIDVTGGELLVSGNMYVNYNTTGNSNISGTIDQSGGTVTINGSAFVGYKYNGTYNISRGTLDIDSGAPARSFYGGYNSGSSGEMNISGNAVVSMNEITWFGYLGDFTLNMTGGKLDIDGKLLVPADEDGSGEINLYGGTIYLNDTDDPLTMHKTGNGHIDIRYNGKMVLDGDRRICVGNYVNAGWITAYDGRGEVNIVYDLNNDVTEVTALLDYTAAYNHSPSDRHVTSSVNTDLYWSGGKDVVSHNVYFGTSYDDVNDANESDSEFKGSQDSNSYDPGTLTAGTTYYWRIDENDVNCGPDGLITWWKFNESSGSTAYDSSGYGYNGTITGASRVSGHVGGALDFEGADLVDINENVFSLIDDEVTFCLWQYGDAAIQPQNDYVLNAADASGNIVFNILIPWSTEKIIWDCGDSSGKDRLQKDASSSNEYEGQWNHWVFTKNVTTGTMKMYLNGELWTSGTSMTKPIGTVATFKLGAHYTEAAGYHYDGMIDDFRIYNRELSADEIDEVYTYSHVTKGKVVSFDIETGTASSDYYVSPDGSDNNSGTLALPFATIAKARDTIRKYSSLPTGGVTVWLRGGKYFIDETIVFDEHDSGESSKPITYSAYQDEVPIISSGVSVTGWSSVAVVDEPDGLPAAASGKLYSADIPAGLGCFKMLFDGNDFLPRACGEPFEPTVTYANADPTRNVLDFPEGTMEEWSNVQDIEIKIIPHYQYVMNILPLQKVNDTTNKAYTAISATYKMGKFESTYWDIFDGNTVWVENAPEGLETAGEWIVNTDSGKIYLWPTGGGAPSGNIVAACLQELIRVEGNEDANTPAEYINFEGITFMQGERDTWTQTQPMIQHEWETLDKGNALLRLKWADNCVVEDCTFTKSGGVGIRLDLHAQNNRIEGNLLNYLGGTGIFLGGYGPGKIDRNKNNEIINNYIHDIGQEYWASFGICVYQSGNNQIENNYMHDLPCGGLYVGGHRWLFFNPNKADTRETASIRFDDLTEDGIELGRATDSNWTELLPYLHARNNTLEKNEVTTCGKKQGDINAIYMSGGGVGNIIARNYLHEVLMRLCSAAIRTDGYVWEADITENIIYNKFGRGVTLSDKNYLENNIIIDLDHTDYGENNWGYIHLKTGPLSGTRIKRNILYHYDNTTPYFYNYNADFIDWADQTGVDVNDNLFYSDKNPSYASSWLSTHQDNNDVDGGSIAEDPMFVAFDNGDFRLDPNSPAISQLDFNSIDFDAIGLLVPEATRPRPGDGATGVRTNSQLSFRAGRYSASHDIYLGTSYSAVSNATTSSDEYQGNFADNDFEPEWLSYSTTYYWRVDEVNSTDTWKGDVWSFTTESCTNLIAYWRFDESSGSTAYDSSGNEYDSTITGASRVSGQVGDAIDFEGSDYVTVDVNLFSLIDDEVTFCFWQYGDAALQPQQDCFFQGNDSSNNRVYNVHLPWSNGYIYWDAGGSSGYDRITKYSVAANYEGQWNHWAFTKNVSTGYMKVILNGVLWNSGSGKTKALGTPSSFHIGSNYNAAHSYYDGMIDDFRIYNAELSVDDINDIYMEGL